MTAAQPRPRVAAGFWLWVSASVLLIVGGMIAATATMDLPPVYRGTAVITILAGGGMAFLAGRSRRDDSRYRRAAVALSLAIVVVVGLLGAIGFLHILTLLAIFPLIGGAVLMTRPSAIAQEESK